MKLIDTNADKLDQFQRRHKFVAFIHAVIKRYGEDQIGFQAALLTYYAFVALFPLLLVVITLTQVIAGPFPELQADIINAIRSYFPMLGDQLAGHIRSLHKNGLALLISLVFILYGARGVAAAFRHGVNHIWSIPKKERLRFPQSLANNMAIIVVGGLGFITAGVLTGLAASAGNGGLARIASIIVDLLVLYWVFIWLLRLALPRTIKSRDVRLGAFAAAAGLIILQFAGGYILGRVMKNLDALYSYFALSLGLLFWLYLQSQLLYVAIELAVVQKRKLWPRSMTGRDLTAADEKQLEDMKQSLLQ